MTAVDERGRAAAVQVDAVLRAEPDEDVGKLRQRKPVIDPRAAAVAGDRDDVLGRDAEGGAWIAPVGDVGVELAGARGETLAVRLAVGSAGASPRSTSRISPLSITTDARRDAYGGRMGSCATGRPSIQRSPSGR
jgi:hypothetical protein